MIFLDKNENPFDVPEKIKQDFIEFVKRAGFNRYPERGLPDLLNAISDLTGYDADNLIAGNGSDELLERIISNSESILISTPTFEMYSFYANNYNKRLINVPLKNDFNIDAERIVESDAETVIICSPNNPTGNLQNIDDIKYILDSGKNVVIDNAYYEFSGYDYKGLVDSYDNLILLRTFSKAFSMAGLRIGYGISKSSIIKDIKRKMPPFYMNILSEGIVRLAVDNYKLIEDRINYIIKERSRVYNEISDMAFKSDANFLLLKKDLYDYMMKNGVMIRKLPLMPGYSRITIGSEDENNVAIKLIKNIK
ncbi:pyridoxal phosphate-dependent aminotransferase [Picrophilus oshimae]|uniref:Histidinol phosphate aminotransferase apoenzyme n=1 Tax=Picrophilus torridus (strain ATCC 700027 / DSM 9790 / JCM 10055 / NBRC 100828 / KAW 2/3) TaxID=1122961 RepID=A0A8G2L852_PICTO|nr:histidinol-phosphate transaminase [Picrophilus oshimae]SMD31049.1 histidinol phosphate aminotransferase apoenzyme [Picrophilus oshimae DSM 9789]